MQITILGGGEIGRAVHSSLKTENSVFLWDQKPSLVPEQKMLSEIIPNSDLVFFCIPSSAIAGALAETAALLKPNAVIISLSKGIEAKSGKFVYEIFEQNLSKSQYALLSGPMLAEELAKGQGAAGVVASENPGVITALQAAFKPNYIRLEYSPDARSVALAGVLKNIYTLILGVSDGLGFGSNIKGFLVSRILGEAEVVAALLGIEEKIMSGTAGLADFIATAFSNYSLNREAGVKIAQMQAPPQSEGLVALPLLLKMLPSRGNLPILSALENIAIKGQDPKTVLDTIIYGA